MSDILVQFHISILKINYGELNMSIKFGLPKFRIWRSYRVFNCITVRQATMSTVNILQCRQVLSKVFLFPRIANNVGGQARQVPGNTAYHGFGLPAETVMYLFLLSSKQRLLDLAFKHTRLEWVFFIEFKIPFMVHVALSFLGTNSVNSVSFEDGRVKI